MLTCNASYIHDYNQHTPSQLLWPIVTIHTRPFVPAKNGSWVEITHCGGSKWENSDAWFYIFPGSGTYINIGRTIAFRSHDHASLYFLGKKCADRRNTDHLRQPQCNAEIPRFNAAARQKGYTSIQFLKHCDARCRGCAHELVILGVSGSSHCPLLEYRNAFHRPCACQKSSYTSRRSFPCGSCKSFPVGHSLGMNESQTRETAKTA